MKISKDSLKIVLVLTIIAVIAGLLLATVNILTKVDDEKVLLDKITKIYPSEVDKQLDVSNVENIKNSLIKNAFLATDGAFIILSKSTKAYSSSGIELIVVIKDDKIVKVEKFKASETPGLGTKALTAEYLAQYIGLDVNKYQETSISANVDTFKIDSVTGATKSSIGVNIAVNAAINYYINTRGTIND